MKKIFLFLTLCLVSCGIPDASSFETLLAPFILDDKTGGFPRCTKTKNGIKVELKIQMFNPESSFSGYNIYYITTFDGISNLEQLLRNTVDAHITNKTYTNKKFNTSTESTSIIKNQNSLPSIPAGDPTIKGYEKEPIISIISIEKNPLNIFLVPEKYGFTVTSVSLPNINESNISNVIAINSSPLDKEAIGTSIYCNASSSTN